MKQAVVLGSRFGGLAVLSWLRRLFPPGELAITVVDQWQEMVFRPGLVHAMMQSAAQVMPILAIPLYPFWSRHKIKPVHDTIVGIDPERREVYTATHAPLTYDVLFIATGATPLWDYIPGLSFHRHGVCEGYLARHTALMNERQPEGRFVFAAGPLLRPASWRPTIDVGCECPLLESALLWDFHLRKIKRRDAAQIVILTPANRIAQIAGSRVQDMLDSLFQQRQIEVITNAQYRQVTDSTIELQDRSVPYDRMAWVPPEAGSRWLLGSTIDDGLGWVPTDAYLNHPDWPEIYAVGDVVSHPWPKMGHPAMVQARLAVHHWAWRQKKQSKKPASYQPQMLWVLEDAIGHALFALSDAFWGGKREIIKHGPLPYLAKEVFQRAYIRTTGALPIMP